MFAKRNDINSLKLIDFGLSMKHNNNEATIFTEKCGTAIYMAPEVFTNYQYSKVTLQLSLVCRPVECWNNPIYYVSRKAPFI